MSAGIGSALRPAIDEAAIVAAAVEYAPTGMIVFALDGGHPGRLVHINPAFVAMMGRSRRELLDGSLEALSHPEDAGPARLALGRMTGAADPVQYEQRLLQPSGATVWALVSAALLPGSGEHRLVVAQIIDISERKREETLLRRLAEHDPLTGLANRRRFQEIVDAEMARVLRHGGAGAILLLDLDRFQTVNDTLGRSAGDRLLRGLATAMTQTQRAHDTVARLGDDEFALVLPETDEGGAARVAERLLDAVRTCGSIVTTRGYAAITASIGIATFDGTQAVGCDELLLRADLAMHRAKQAGRDRALAYQVGALVVAPPPLIA